MKTATRKLNVISHQELGDIRNVTIKGETYFVAKDVCNVLGLSKYRDAIANLDTDEKGCPLLMDTHGGMQEMTTINESGLYSLVFQSRKPEAKAFRKWVTSEVLPAIRRHGFYINPSAQLSRVEFRRLERSMRENMNKYISPEDIWKCHLKLRVSESYIRRVMDGLLTNNLVMSDLQDRALSNQERFVNAYSPQRMQDVIKALSIKK